VPVPKWLLAGVALLAAFLIGGLLRATMADDSRATEVGPADPSSRELAAPRGESAAQPVYVTIVVAEAPVGPEGRAGPVVEAVRAARYVHAGRVRVLAARPGQTLVSSTRSPGRSVALASGQTQMRRSGTVASASAPTLSIMSNQPRVPGVTLDGGNAPGTPTVSWPVELHGIDGPEGFSVFASGNDIVIANNGSIVSVGDNTVLTANTGDAGASGVIALGVVDSAVTSGSSGLSGWAGGSSPPPPGWPTGTQGSVSTAATSSASGGGGPGTRAVAIAGYEDRTLEVVGNDNLLTNNDSNLFFHRAGLLNGNTGDTHTSGLNVVDATGSLVRSGSSGAPPDPAALDQTSVGSSPAVVGSAPAPGAASASVAGANGTATATGADSLVIGGAGVVDAGVQMHGDRNVTTSDDGNVAVGGVGDVNAQVGDSDTSGAVVMDVADSEITTGSSVAPAGTPPPDAAPAGDPTTQPPTLP